MPQTVLTFFEHEEAELGELLGKACLQTDGKQPNRLRDLLLKLTVARDQLTLDPSDDRGQRSEDDDDGDEDASRDRVHVFNPTRGATSIRTRHLVGSATVNLDGQPITIEVLPKIGDKAKTVGDDDKEVAKKIARLALKHMWMQAQGLAMRWDTSEAGMEEAASQPLHEWLIDRFLRQLEYLLGAGLRANYIEHEDNLTTVRGRLLVQENMRRNALAPYRFFCRHDEFSLDRPENRLIHSALDRVWRKSGQSFPAMRRRAGALALRLAEIPVSRDIRRDFMAWRTDRIMANYREIRETCRWILEEKGPAPVRGDTPSFGRFVRMNDVFEGYVGALIRKRLGHEYQVVEQRRAGDDRQFCTVDGRVAMLRPDILINHGNQCIAVMDVKWKIPGKEPGRTDLYQLFAYVQHFLPRREVGAGDVIAALVYPGYSTKPTDLSFEFALDRDRAKGDRVIGRRLCAALSFDHSKKVREGFQFSGDSDPCWMKKLRLT